MLQMIFPGDNCCRSLQEEKEESQLAAKATLTQIEVRLMDVLIAPSGQPKDSRLTTEMCCCKMREHFIMR